MFCSTCGAEIQDSAVVCPKCGVPTSQADLMKAALDKPMEKAHNSVSGFVFGLLGFMLDWFPIVGFVLSIIGVSMCSKGKKAMRQNPGNYTGTGFLTAGQILSIIGIIMSSFVLIATIIWGIFLGEGFWALFELMDIL